MPSMLGLIATAPVLIIIISPDKMILSSPAVTAISLLLMNSPCPVYTSTCSLLSNIPKFLLRKREVTTSRWFNT